MTAALLLFSLEYPFHTLQTEVAAAILLIMHQVLLFYYYKNYAVTSCQWRIVVMYLLASCLAWT